MIGAGNGSEPLDLKTTLQGVLARPVAARKEEDPRYERALRAAAVSSFFEVGELAATLPDGDTGDVLRRLKADCVATVRDGRRLWILSGRRRRDVFRQWRPTMEEAMGAIAALRVGELDALADMIERYVGGSAPPLVEQSLAQLSGTEQISTWLAEFAPDVPPRALVQCEIERRDLTRPFVELAGPSIHFSGRTDELDRLREHVGVLDRHVPADAWLRRFTELLGSRRRSLPVVGVGGAGKSTLIAKFLLDHVLFDDPRQIPFAYLDFDRPSLDARDAPGLLLECVKQLRSQYPRLRDSLSSLSEAWRDRLEREGVYDSDESAQGRIGSMLPRFATELAEALRPVAGAQTPFLIVLDTFEEALYVGDTEPTRLLIQALEGAFPTLRTVIAGRVEPPREFGLERPLRLTAFNAAAATAFLMARGVRRATARGLARQMPRTPLLLRLAADLALKEDAGEGGLAALRTHGLVFRLSDAAMASQLHARILGHIHDEDARKLAHPGLILRKITPDVIQRVLSEPCGVDVPSRARADELYERLRREVALVSEHDGALFHRKDVRAFTLKAMSLDQPSRAADLHLSAIRYYERRPDLSDRAEELYHRLSLGQVGDPVQGRWIDGAERSILPNLAELPAESRAFMARFLGRMPDKGAEEAASADDWAALSTKQAGDALAVGAPLRALEIVATGARAGRGGPAAQFVEGQALGQLGRWREASTALSAVLMGESRSAERSSLRAELATLSFNLGRLDEAREFALASIAASSGRERSVLSSLTILVATERLRSDRADGGSAARLLAAAQAADTGGVLTAEAARRVVSLIGDDEPAAVEIACRRVGTSTWTGEDLAFFAQALAGWDEGVSIRTGVAPGTLARRMGIGDGEPNLVWSLYVANALPEQLAVVVQKLLRIVPMLPSESLLFSELFRRRTPEWIELAGRSLEEAYRRDDTALRLAARSLLVDFQDWGDIHLLAQEFVRAADRRGALLECLEPLAVGCEGSIVDVVGALGRWRDAARGRGVEEDGAVRTAMGAVEGLRGTRLQLVTAFFSLDVDRRLAVARRLGLLEEADLRLNTSELSRLILRRAAERGMLTAVESWISSSNSH